MAEARARWRAELAGIDPRRLVFLDETGIDTRLTKAYGRAPRGRRATGKVPWGRWERLTVIGALALDGGVVASMSIDAATSTAVFLAFVEQVLTPALRGRPGTIVVMDNLAAHKAEAVRDALDRAGLHHRYLPPSSPDLNPIEPAFAKLKEHPRSAAARTFDGLVAAIGAGPGASTAADARGFYAHCGFTPPPRPEGHERSEVGEGPLGIGGERGHSVPTSGATSVFQRWSSASRSAFSAAQSGLIRRSKSSAVAGIEASRAGSSSTPVTEGAEAYSVAKAVCEGTDSAWFTKA